MGAESTVTADRRWLALIVLCTGMLMIVLDGTIVNVALPTIQTDLGFSQSSLAWVINAYLIPFGGLLLLAGRLGDLVGRKRILLVGLATFTSASILCGVATTEFMLIGGRFLQGVGGAFTSAVILGMIVTMFPEPAERVKAIGVFSFVATSGASIGLILGGVLTQALNWHWIFFVNVPIGILTGILAARLLPHEDGIGMSHGADAPGAALITGAVMVGVYSIVEAADRGWTSFATLGLGALAILLLLGFLLREWSTENPLMPLVIFRDRIMIGANAVQVLVIAGLFGVFFLGALYLQKVSGFSTIEVGLAFLPVVVAIAALSLRVTPQLVTRYGSRPVILPGLVLTAAGLAFLARIPVPSNYFMDFMPAMLLIGVGAGLVFPALTTLAMSDATDEDSGLTSGLFNTSQQVGGALGLAVLATLSTMRADNLMQAGTPATEALTAGYRLAFVVATGIALVALPLAAVVLRPVPDGQVAKDAIRSDDDSVFATPEINGTSGCP